VSGAIDCISGDPCEESSCNPLTGECEVTGVSCAAGALCDGHECEDEDTDPCTNGFCAGGVCVAGAVTCISGNSCEDSNCNPQTGECEITVLPDGTPCTDGQACTVSDVCTGGVCVGQAEDCSFLNDECNVGVCNVDGVCVTQPANEGGPCDDLDACTNPDTCQNGTCTGVVIPGC